MLGDENRVAAKGSLLAVVSGFRRRQPPGDEIPGVGQDRVHPLRFQIVSVPRGQSETLPERGASQAFEEVVEIGRHGAAQLSGSAM